MPLSRAQGVPFGGFCLFALLRPFTCRTHTIQSGWSNSKGTHRIGCNVGILNGGESGSEVMCKVLCWWKEGERWSRVRLPMIPAKVTAHQYARAVWYVCVCRNVGSFEPSLSMRDFGCFCKPICKIREKYMDQKGPRRGWVVVEGSGIKCKKE